MDILVGHKCGRKSILLKTIPKKSEISAKFLFFEERTSYTSKFPYLFSSTIKHNLLIGEQSVEQKYNLILDICALDFDSKLFGNKTIIGNC